MNDLLQRSAEIAREAALDYKPHSTILMMSGGKDSMLTYQVAKTLGIKIDFIMHGWTRTGIFETTEFVRAFAMREGVPYIESDAGDSYRKYVLKNGFFGVGRQSHSVAYHLLKSDHFRSNISRHIRHGQRGRNVVMLSGARRQESANRAKNIDVPVRREKVKSPNIWAALCHEWGVEERNGFLEEVKAPINPVTQRLCRSGECMCGTMQSPLDRAEAATEFPAWGKWIRDISNEVYAAGHDWGWGEDMSPRAKAAKVGQMSMFDEDEYQPMCVSCKIR